ncbi:MAG: hypothetical protein Phog2KO_23260 [Phototrophicaceae bacterium]
MNTGQTKGMILITLGFVIIVIAGITLSFLAGSVLNSAQTLLAGIIIFIVLAPIFGYGILTYARATEAETYVMNTDMEKPRLLMDYLREHGQADISLLADELQTTPKEIQSYIQDLSDLSLFSGIADWDNGVIAMLQPSVIEALDKCKNCKNPIKILNNATTCQHCGTEYYKL